MQIRVPGGGPAEARRVSFRALDIEQIGHVYEGLLDHTAKRASEPMLGLAGTRDQEPEIALADLEKIVRSEAYKADQHVLGWAAEDIKRSEKIWAQNGGKEIQLPPAEQKRFLDESIAATTPILTATPQGKEDYEAFAAAARKYRK